MRKMTILAIVLAFALLVVPIPAAPAALDPGSAADDHRPTEIIEYGHGLNAGLVRVTHIHYVKDADKVRGGKPPGPTESAVCYKLIGWKWPAKGQYKIKGSDAEYAKLYESVSSATDVWDAATTANLFTPAVWTPDGTWGGNTPDYVNLITFGDYPQDGVIAVTMTWYNSLDRTVIDSDILFDTDFTWGDATKVSGVMDTKNIATHEIGHSLGLSDLYKKPCTAVTMYGYSWNGDIGKRTLEPSDEAGIRAIYGV